MNDRGTRAALSSGTEARRAVPRHSPVPTEGFRQDAMIRYLQAMASHEAQEAAADAAEDADRQSAAPGTVVRPAKDTVLRVRDVMKRSAEGISPETPFEDIARELARQETGAAPVVDEEQHVVGVVAESDLLARAAALADPDGAPGGFGLLHGRRRRIEREGTTAGALMTEPAITVQPWTSVIDAARTASRSRVRQIFVTDHHNRLLGVVSRSELLEALVRDED
ncbi:CBS domain-containing protein [Streptomyces sp. DI166]|uniref:CBS domain-containing protein n=1 Tax=Streptomyces sp. DI166 TaxID=1839783 RepID=UPI0007F51A08|nr:CBS domain-containing protein [Streptomyces sp. DI166]WBO76104.1 CBS domain-containing protein [Streptomyces sp. SBE_14.2]SBT89631.1 CBS domain-containing protein [Streptomyces sp. DI166]